MDHSSFIFDQPKSKFANVDDGSYTLVKGKKLGDYTPEQQAAMRHDYLDVAMRGGNFSEKCKNRYAIHAKDTLIKTLEDADPGLKKAREGYAHHKAQTQPAAPSIAKL